MERNYQQYEANSPLLPIHWHNTLGFCPHRNPYCLILQI